MKKNDYFLVIYDGRVVLVYRINDRYYLENKKEIKKSDFIFIA